MDAKAGNDRRAWTVWTMLGLGVACTLAYTIWLLVKGDPDVRHLRELADLWIYNGANLML